MKAPCKDCPDRYLGCHDHCEKYKEFDAERKRIHDISEKQHQIDYDYFRIRKHSVRKGRHK